MKGRSLQRESSVTLLEPRDDEIVRAEVADPDTGPHTVILAKDDRHVAVDCDCEEFQEQGICKHLWATLLALDDSEDHAGPRKQLRSLRVRPPRAKRRETNGRSSASKDPAWMGKLSLMRAPGVDLDATRVANGPRRVTYVVMAEFSDRHHGLFIETRQSTPTANGWSRPKPLRLNASTIAALPDSNDRSLCALLMGSTGLNDPDAFETARTERAHSLHRLPPGAQRELLKRLADTGRCFVENELDRGQDLNRPLTYLDATSWNLWLKGLPSEESLFLAPELRRGEERLRVDEPDVILGGPDGLIIAKHQACPLDDHDAFRWVSQFRDPALLNGQIEPIHVESEDYDRFFDRLYLLPQLPRIDLPDHLGPMEHQIEPVPHLELFSAGSSQANETLGASGKNNVMARVWLAYGTQRVSPAQPGRYVPILPTDTPTPEASTETPPTDSPAESNGHAQAEDDPGARRLVPRLHARERAATEKLLGLGFRSVATAPADTFALANPLVATVVNQLSEDGWNVTADQRALRTAGTPSLSITSNIDWFELRGNVRFTQENGVEQIVPLPELLGALRAGQSMITLDDGSQGLLPEQWLEEHKLLTSLGKPSGDAFRFSTHQAAVLDGLLTEANAEIQFDEAYTQMRERLKGFEGVDPIDPAEGFQGELRPYQAAGVGWLNFLRWFGMGGVLADDMGLGKTVQVLTLLHARATGDERFRDHAVTNGSPKKLPSLIVAPRSVVYNWLDEAQRFTPELRVGAYVGVERDEIRQKMDDLDVVVTTYGLVRRDIEILKQQPFDFVVLDEAQAIKNPGAQAAKSARVLDANHRLALTGTPIENHLGDLWSIFEFLNPGMLGSHLKFADLVRSGRQADPAMLKQISAALRPFILRRTKAQVLKDLPEKTEQTIVCEMEPAQRAAYDELKAYYRGNLLNTLDTTQANQTTEPGTPAPRGLGQSTFMVLEALLRLRQAACHPGLVDPARRHEPSAKCDALYEMLGDVIEEGGKALVFSQFTSMLAIVREGLEQRGIKYAYLDGQTRDRRAVVKEFQEDEACQVFLISLKAGGFGLNLTAAEYVFILDPWWNPAVEAQAIDRAHRIGQTRPVFAYRMVCQDTVEQHILELQDRKRELADAIVGGEGTPLRDLTREDLERLLA